MYDVLADPDILVAVWVAAFALFFAAAISESGDDDASDELDPRPAAKARVSPIYTVWLALQIVAVVMGIGLGILQIGIYLGYFPSSLAKEAN